MSDISTKWPAARLRGPDVSIDNALDFIMRTDPFLVGGGFTNDRLFEASYRKLAGLSDDLYGGTDDWQEMHAKEARFKDAMNHIALEHLGSHWVANAHIAGPFGPVSPSGKVILAINFGKWPSVEEIESDLNQIAPAFPWLEFDLSVWGHSQEGDEGMPSHTWHLENGGFSLIEPKVLQVSEPDIMTAFMKNFGTPGRETTWSVAQIDKMWGDKIRAASQA